MEGKDVPEVLPNGKYNPENIKVSRVYANFNLLAGKKYWKIKNWNPKFGDIKKYKLCKLIGAGSYSEVFVGLRDDKQCAIKVLKPTNNDRIRREIKILTNLKEGPHILTLLDTLICPKSRIISIVMEYVPNQPWRTLINSITLEGVRMITYNLLKSLAYTHSHGIMHRDVKPSNILCVNPEKDVVLADWGLAEFYHPLRKYSTRVGTRSYKAPELILEYGFYNYSVDIWALGVTMLEFLTKKIHIFQSTDPEKAIYPIANIFGGQKIINLTEKYNIEIGPVMINNLKNIQGKGIRSCFAKAKKSMINEDAINLLEKMLVIDHRDRITAEEALNHPFFSSIKDK